MNRNNKRYTIESVFEISNLDEIEKIRKKLNSGLDINVVDSGGRTLLMQACIEQNHELIEILLKMGAAVNIREERNWTALHFAAQNHDITAMTLLIEKGADVNAKDDYDNSVILKATSGSGGNGESIRLLLKHGADCKVKNKSGISALDLAKMVTNFDLMQYFSGID